MMFASQPVALITKIEERNQVDLGMTDGLILVNPKALEKYF